jgi:hypothetical protein
MVGGPTASELSLQTIRIRASAAGRWRSSIRGDAVATLRPRGLGSPLERPDVRRVPTGLFRVDVLASRDHEISERRTERGVPAQVTEGLYGEIARHPRGSEVGTRPVFCNRRGEYATYVDNRKVGQLLGGKVDVASRRLDRAARGVKLSSTCTRMEGHRTGRGVHGRHG